MEEKTWYVKSRGGSVYGPASEASFIEWAREGRIDPSGSVSTDRTNWVPPQSVGLLGMKWLIETDNGDIFGPFHLDVVKRMFSDGTVPKDSRIYCRWDKPLAEEVAEENKSVAVADVVVEPVDDKPAKASFGGIFEGADAEQLASLEAAAQKELFAAKKFGLGGIFGRK